MMVTIGKPIDGHMYPYEPPKPNDHCTNFEVRAKGDGVLEMIKLNCDICPIDKLTCGVYAAYNKAKTYSVSFKFDKEDKE